MDSGRGIGVVMKGLFMVGVWILVVGWGVMIKLFNGMIVFLILFGILFLLKIVDSEEEMEFFGDWIIIFICFFVCWGCFCVGF